ncbi:hypothetical protein CONPUDRAFT_161186 [Coniophora puteana RWD-64-598 SS2]|uniref:RING-type domain-containing protein n=1 Tax=Coniophora puteana (strain RWD-64-598) TaxID=741705 RepID=A0A5M3N558_CONPW|nr:uncharacterized protein CONPUDRAFT_161186 [Coniophora puteana RWD-64-598 SS2]EIW86436.1 hypothetical protein CONPUDRAFT_161186 [Coniophora puteana RWD-64-598 SS2]
MPTDSDDEFDTLPDELEGVDFSTIPALSQAPVAHLRPSTSRRASPHSSNYGFDDELDDSTLAQVDALEAQALMRVPDAGGSRQPIVGQSVSCETPMARQPQAPAVHSSQHDSVISSKRSCPFPSPSSEKRAGKAKESSEAHDITVLFDILDHEVSCPICCDLFVAAHIGNPCGHSYCGDCGFAWVSQNERAPTCPVCRRKLKKSQPLLRNFSVDNFVQAYIRTQVLAGQTDWFPGGSKLAEWNARQEMWKLSDADRSEKTRKTHATSSRGRHAMHQPPILAPPIRYMHSLDLMVVSDDEDEDPTWQEGFVPANVHPGHGQRSTTRRSTRADASW